MKKTTAINRCLRHIFIPLIILCAAGAISDSRARAEMGDAAKKKIAKCFELKPFANAANLGWELRLTETAGESISPNIAYNAANQEFGIVWQEMEGMTSQVYFTRANTAGQKVDEDILISNGVSDAKDPVIAWSPLYNAYLIAWTDSRDCIMEYYQGDYQNQRGEPSGARPEERREEDRPGRGEREKERGSDRDRNGGNPWVKVGIIPNKTTLITEDTVNLTIHAECSPGSTINKIEYALIIGPGAWAETKIFSGYFGTEEEKIVSETLTEPYDYYCFAAIAHATNGDKNAVNFSLSPAISVVPPTPCAFFHQIYAHVVDGASGQLIYNDPLRITDPYISDTADKPALSWNENRGTFGLIWLESRKENGVQKEGLFFNEMFLDNGPFSAKWVASLPYNKKITTGLKDPWGGPPSLAANDDGYAVAYQDRREPLPNNIYLRRIDGDLVVGPEIKASDAQSPEGGYTLGAVRPKLIRTRMEEVAVPDPVDEEKEWWVERGEDWLILTWEEQGSQYLQRYDPNYIIPATSSPACLYAGNSELVTPAVGCHGNGLGVLTHKWDMQDGWEGELIFTLRDFSGGLKTSPNLECFPGGFNLARVDDGDKFSCFPSMAWSGDIYGAGAGVYGVVWQDRRFGVNEIYFRMVMATDNYRWWANPEIDNDCGWTIGCKSCAEVHDLYCQGEDVGPGPGGDGGTGFIPPEKINVFVFIEPVMMENANGEEVPKTEGGQTGNYQGKEVTLGQAHFLVYRVKAYSASGSYLTSMKCTINGQEIDGKRMLYYPNADPAIFTEYSCDEQWLPNLCDPGENSCTFPYAEKTWGDRYEYEVVFPNPGGEPWVAPVKVDVEAWIEDANGEEATASAHWEKMLFD
ncbi:MAG: hypothetical protein V1789_08550 [PVC group bacterium]